MLQTIAGFWIDQLVSAGGSLLDIGSGGLTLFLGSGIGAIVGGASAWFGSKQLIGARVLGLPMGGNQIIVGPITNLNFAWILLGRAVSHLRLICQRTHARRDSLEIEHQTGSSIVENIPHPQRRAIQRIFTRASKSQEVNESELNQLSVVITGLVADPKKLNTPHN